MKILNFFTTALIFILLTSCNVNRETNEHKGDNNQQVPNYIINEDLSSKDYVDFKGYIPKEGLIPTANVAFQFAEIIFTYLYGEDIIEKEKPFSIKLENGIWIIEGYFNRHQGGIATTDGGVAYIEIRKSNGEILKVIHTK